MATATGTANEAPARTKNGVVPVRTRRSWVYAAGAAALIIVGGVGSVFVYSSSSNTQQVFVVGSAIERGDTIASSDLTTINIAAGQTTAGIPATDTSDVIGKVATVDLPKGSLVTKSSVANALAIPSGQALVGIALKPAQLPAQTLAAGDHIVIVPVASTDGTGVATTGGAPPVTGVVSSTRPSQSSGTTTVDVYVNARTAADVASRAAAGTVAIYLAGSER